MKKRQLQPLTPEMLPEVSGSAAKLYAALHLKLDQAGVTEASLDELAEQTGLTERTIRTVRVELFEKKLVNFGQTPAGHNPGRGYLTIYQLWTPAGDKNPSLGAGKKPSSTAGIGKNFPPYISYIENIPIKPTDTKRDSNKNRKKKGVEGGNILSPGEELVLLTRAAGIIGVPIKARSANMDRIKSSMRTRLKEGYTEQELVDACHYAAKEWDGGVHFRQLKDLGYVWSRGFESLLATKGESGIKTGRKAPVFREGEEMDAFKEQVRRRTEEKE